MKKKIYLILSGLLLLLAAPQSSAAQHAPDVHVSSTEQDSRYRTKPASGTYQIIYSDSAHAEAIHSDMLLSVEAARHATEVKYLVINEFITVKILPEAVIRAKDFIPLEEYIIAE